MAGVEVADSLEDAACPRVKLNLRTDRIRRRSCRDCLNQRRSSRRLLDCRRRLRQRWSASLSSRTRHGSGHPHNPTRKRHHPFDETAYRQRNVIERMFCRLKDWRRIATRYDKLAANLRRRRHARRRHHLVDLIESGAYIVCYLAWPITTTFLPRIFGHARRSRM
jgi:transposase